MLTSLPALPFCTELYCENNQLTTLSDIPYCTILYCYNNQLTSLPVLPNCTVLRCCNNKYLHINSYIAYKFNIPETPDYNRNAKTLQTRFLHKRIYKNMTTISILVDEVKYRPDSVIISEIASKYSMIMML